MTWTPQKICLFDGPASNKTTIMAFTNYFHIFSLTYEEIRKKTLICKQKELTCKIFEMKLILVRHCFFAVTAVN